MSYSVDCQVKDNTKHFAARHKKNNALSRSLSLSLSSLSPSLNTFTERSLF